MDYQLSSPLSFKDDKNVYKLNIVKQAGLLKDPFEWKLVYPINYKIVNGAGEKKSVQEMGISTDLSTDRIFEVTFQK